MIEEFNREYEDFFNEPNYQVRWQRLTEIHSKDYSSFRVLFAIETLALLDKWRELNPLGNTIAKVFTNANA